jgi:hypothetical protein
VDVGFGGVIGGGLDDLSVGDGGLGFDEGFDDGGGWGVGDDDVYVAGGFDVAPGDATVGEGLDVAPVEGRIISMASSRRRCRRLQWLGV